MNRILGELEKQGFQVRTVSIAHLLELQEAIKRRHDIGEFSEEFYQERLADFRFAPPESLPGARTVIIAAFPQPKIQVVFRLHGKSFPFLIPPTYLYYPDLRAEELLTRILSSEGFRAARTNLPLKLLAARSGLGSYGRNNIFYVPGMGSYHRLMAFYSDQPAAEDSWQADGLMERCRNCRACLQSCPTGAITADRFLLHADRCLTYLNEKPGEFPDWVKPSFHNALVGCLTCQDVCPENAPFRKWIESGEEFSEEESLLLLGDTDEKLPASIHKKLQDLDLMAYVELLPRNVRAVLAAANKESPGPEKRS
jgi:epoxyqueuosine reductase